VPIAVAATNFAARKAGTTNAYCRTMKQLGLLDYLEQHQEIYRFATA